MIVEILGILYWNNSLNTIAKLGNMTSFGSISITNATLYDAANAEVALKLASNAAISLNGAFKLTAGGAIELGGAATIKGAKSVDGGKAVTITATKFSDKTFTLSLAQADSNPADISAKFNVTTWELTAATTSIAIAGAGSSFSGLTIYDGSDGVAFGTAGNLYITSLTNATSISYRSGKVGKFLSQLPKLDSTVRSKMKINSVAVTDSNFTGTGISYTGTGKVYIDDFQDSDSTNTSDYMITGREIVIGNGTDTGTVSRFGRDLTLIANGGGNLGITQTSTGSTLQVVRQLSLQVQDNGAVGGGGIDLSKNVNSIASLGTVSGGSLSLITSVNLTVGAITTGGDVRIVNTAGVTTLNGTITAGTGKLINLVGSLTLAADVTTNADTFIAIGAGAFVNGGFKLEAAVDKNISFSFNRQRHSDPDRNDRLQGDWYRGLYHRRQDDRRWLYRQSLPPDRQCDWRCLRCRSLDPGARGFCQHRCHNGEYREHYQQRKPDH